MSTPGSAQTPAPRRKWSRIGQLAKGAAISQANRARAERNRQREGWSARDMKTVMDLYPDYSAILEALPGRTYNQVKNFIASYQLGTKRHVWTNQEVSRLRTVAKAVKNASEIFKTFPEFTSSQIRSVAKTNRIPWPKRSLKMLGVPLLDDVRRQALGMNLSLRDLDEIAGGGEYFSDCYRHLDLKKLTAVVEFMGGRLTVQWSDEADDGR